MATTSSFKVACPSCEAMVPIKDQSLVGKKVDCPKCKYRFVVESPDDGEGGNGKPAAKKAAGATVKAGAAAAGRVNGEARAKPKPLPRRDEDEGEDESTGKKKKTNTTLLIGGGIGVLAILLLVGGWALGWFGDSSSKSSTPSANTKGTAPRPQAQGKTEPENNGNAEVKEDPKKDEIPSFSGRDITNLLPDSSQLVIAADARKFLGTPIGISLFDQNGGTEKLVKDRLGFGSREVSKVLFASNLADGWTWTVVQTRKAMTAAQVKAAIDPKAEEKTRKNKTYYVTQENEIFKMLGAYLAEQLKSIGSPFPDAPGARRMAFNLVDSQTLIISDIAQVERFLDLGSRWPELSVIQPAPKVGGGIGNSDPNNPNGEENMPMLAPHVDPQKPENLQQGPRPGGPMYPMGPMGPGGPMYPMPGGPMYPGAPKKGNAPLFTNNPTYRTIDPNLKNMLNRLDEKNDAVLAVAFKLSTSAIGPGVLDFIKTQGEAGIPALLLKAVGTTVVGVCVSECTPTKFRMTAGVELANAKIAQELQKPISEILLPALQHELSNMLNIPIEIRGQNSQFGPGNGPGPGGNPMYPMGGGGQYPRPSPGPGGRTGSGDNIAPAPLQSGPRPGPMQPPGGGPMYPMPGGPMYPMPGGPMYPMPGGTNDPNNPNRPKIDSFLQVSTQDNVITLTTELHWRVVYNSRVIPPLRSLIESQRGRVTMLAGRNNWLNLGPAVIKFQSQPAYPRGALARAANLERFGLAYAPDQRVSWMVELLPHLGYDLLYQAVDKEKSWNHEFNLAAGEQWVPEFLDPTAPPNSFRAVLPSLRGRVLGATHFVGTSGIGLDSADYPDDEAHAKLLGIFGNERETKLQDVIKGDGLSNTILMAQVAPDMQRPWIRGGGSTVQGVPQQDSFRPFNSQLGNRQFGTHILMADGSWRFLSSTTSPEVLKALVTYKGGEKVDNLDVIAPKIGGKLEPKDNSSDGSTRIVGIWRDFFVPEMLGTVKFPGRPERKEVVVEVKSNDPNNPGPMTPPMPPMPNNPQGPNSKQVFRATGDVWYAWISGTLRMVLKLEKPRGTLQDGGEQDLDRIMNGQFVRYAEWAINNPTDVQKTTINGTPARTFNTANADGRFHHLLFIYNRRIVELYAPSERIHPDDLKEFFTSVKIEDPQLNRWQHGTVAFAGVRLSADFPGKPLKATSDENLTERAWTVNFPSGARFYVNVRGDTGLPDTDTEGKTADKLIEDIRAKYPKAEVFDVKRADASGIEGREVKRRNASQYSVERLWVVGGTHVTARIYEPERIKPDDMKRFFNSIKISRGAEAPAEPKKEEPKKTEPKKEPDKGR